MGFLLVVLTGEVDLRSKHRWTDSVRLWSNAGKRFFLVLGLLLGLLCCLHRASVFSVDLWFEVSLAAFSFVIAFGRLQVRENGIMQYCSCSDGERSPRIPGPRTVRVLFNEEVVSLFKWRCPFPLNRSRPSMSS